jgi:serpin B
MLLLTLLLIASGCARASTTITPEILPTAAASPTPAENADHGTVNQPFEGKDYLLSDKVRILAPSVPTDDLIQLSRGNNAFALALYQELKGGSGNLFLSPYSISLALAMTYAGARGSTEVQMADALHFTLPQDRLHQAFNSLDQTIASYAQSLQDPQTKTGLGFRLDIANSIWGQQDFPFRPEYLDLLALNYGAGMHLVDFIHAPNDSRLTINDWVSQQTHEKIKDILTEGSITDLTRLVLANAIYFKASWMNAFDPDATRDGDFFLPDGTSTSVPMMHLPAPATFLFSEGDDFLAVGLPYQGGSVMMAILMPTDGSIAEFEAGLTDTRLESILTGLAGERINLTMPKFRVDSKFSLTDPLTALGMPDAFWNADFSGIDGGKDLAISDVIHEAYVNVDESGTEAAAATLSIVGVTSAQESPRDVAIDHPFLFLIYDPQTNTILFMGRVINPEG